MSLNLSKEQAAELQRSNKEWLESTRDFSLDPGSKARLDAWKRKWGYLPPEPPAMELANALNERLERRWLVDRTAADDQLSGKAFTAKRREALKSAVGTSYLADEYGLRTAMDMRPMTEHRGMRAEHASSSKYVRDNPGGVNALCKSMLAGTTIPPERHNDVLFINSPTVIDKVKTLYGDKLFPPSQCPNAACPRNTPSGPGAKPTKLRAANPGELCPDCQTALVPYPTVVEIAPGLHGFLPEFNASAGFPTATPFGEEKNVTGLAGQKDVLAEMMKSLGATPSIYQAFKAVNQGKDTLQLLAKPVGNDARLKQVTGPALAGFNGISADHPMRVVADAAVNLVRGLGNVLDAPAPIKLPDDAEQRYRVRRGRLEAGLDTFKDARNVEQLKPLWTDFDNAMGAAATQAAETKWDAGNVQLDKAEELAKQLRAERMNRDPLLANSVAQLEALLAAMPAMANDTPRFTKLFDLLTDEMHIILSVTKPYDDASFKQTAAAQLKQRAPSVAALSKDVEVTPHLVSSGMDALTTGVVAARKALGQPAEIVGEGANYFETPAILSHTSIMGDTGPVIVGSLNPSTPTTPPSDARTLIDKVKTKLTSAEATAKFALVVDVTIEKGDKTKTDMDLVFADPQIAQAIDDGRLSVTVCKSYQKYPGLGVGKVMAGSTTTIARKGAFPGADEFLNSTDDQQNSMQNDESQLMTHLVAHAGEQGIGLEQRAAHNAATLAGMVRRKPDDPIATANDGLPFVLVGDGATPLIGPDKRPIAMAKLLPLLGVEERDSFGFQNSSYLEIPSGIRINTGQEPEEALTEKFHALVNVGIKAQAANADGQRQRDSEITHRSVI